MASTFKDKKTSVIYKFIRFCVKLFYPKMKVEGTENLPKGASIVVANHSQMHGPIACELYYPGPHYIWCIAEMMEMKEVPAYAFQDFWSKKPGYIRWFFKLLSYLIAPLSQCIFTNAHTIPVYKNKRIFETFQDSLDKLKAGNSVVIFPEEYTEHNNIVHNFQQGFVSLAKRYYRDTGEEISFVPLYLCPSLKKMVIGKPVRYDHDARISDEQTRICDYLMNEISETAYALPRHRVVPYPNVSKKEYPDNRRP